MNNVHVSIVTFSNPAFRLKTYISLLAIKVDEVILCSLVQYLGRA